MKYAGEPLATGSTRPILGISSRPLRSDLTVSATCSPGASGTTGIVPVLGPTLITNRSPRISSGGTGIAAVGWASVDEVVVSLPCRSDCGGTSAAASVESPSRINITIRSRRAAIGEILAGVIGGLRPGGRP